MRADSSAHRTDTSGPWQYNFEAQVLDVDNQTVTQHAYFEFHDRDTYLGVDSDHNLVVAGQDIEVGVIAIAPDGRLRRGVRADVELVRRDWHTVDRRRPGGSYHASSDIVEHVQDTCRVRTRARGIEATIDLGGRPLAGLMKKERQRTIGGHPHPDAGAPGHVRRGASNHAHRWCPPALLHDRER